MQDNGRIFYILYVYQYSWSFSFEAWSTSTKRAYSHSFVLVASHQVYNLEMCSWIILWKIFSGRIFNFESADVLSFHAVQYQSFTYFSSDYFKSVHSYTSRFTFWRLFVWECLKTVEYIWSSRFISHNSKSLFSTYEKHVVSLLRCCKTSDW